jgi:SagB-type dehydrogenase family enzyme
MENDFNRQIIKNREFLKDRIRKSVDFSLTEQSKGVPVPAIEKPHNENGLIINLSLNESWEEKYDISLSRAIMERKSHRKFKDEPLTLDELSYLLWATQGLRKVIGGHGFRNVPSAGCRHAMETYIAVFNVDGLDGGIYRYLPLSHRLVFEFNEEELGEKVVKAAFGQGFAGKSALTFIWTAIPHRMEWRYGPVSHKVIAMDAGHMVENLYLACAAVKSGTCAIGAYDQDYADELLRVDGMDEFVIYLAPVGKI